MLKISSSAPLFQFKKLRAHIALRRMINVYASPFLDASPVLLTQSPPERALARAAFAPPYTVLELWSACLPSLGAYGDSRSGEQRYACGAPPAQSATGTEKDTGPARSR